MSRLHKARTRLLVAQRRLDKWRKRCVNEPENKIAVNVRMMFELAFIQCLDYVWAEQELKRIKTRK